MDFIERIFGINPDGGSGRLEFLILALPVAVIAWFVVYRRRRSKG